MFGSVEYSFRFIVEDLQAPYLLYDVIPVDENESYENNQYSRSQSHNQGSNVVFKCPVEANPPPEIVWEYLSVDEINNSSSGNTSELLKTSNKINDYNHLYAVESEDEDYFDEYQPIENFVKIENAKNSAQFSRTTTSNSGLSLTINNLNKNDEGTYRCLAHNPLGRTQYQYQLKVNTVPVILIFNESDDDADDTSDSDDALQNKNKEIKPISKITAISGDEITFKCPAIGAPRPEINWNTILSKNNYHIDEKIDDNDENKLISSLTVPNLVRDHSGQFICRVSNSAGSVSHSFMLDIKHAPIITPDSSLLNMDHPDNPENFLIEILDGDNLSIPCYTTSNPAPTIKWFLNDTLYTVKTADDHYLNIENVKLNDHAGIWTCLASNEIGESQQSYSVKVHFAPKLEYFGLNPVPEKKQVKMVGSDLSIVCPIEGNPVPEYSWVLESESDLKNPITYTKKLELTNLDFSNIGEYICNTKNKYGTSSFRFNLNIIEAPKIIDSSEKEILVNDCQSFYNCNREIYCFVEGNPLPKVTWSVDGQMLSNSKKKFVQDITNHNSFSLTSTIIAKKPGLYQCEATNIYGKASISTNLIFEIAPNLSQEFLPIEYFNQNLMSYTFDNQGNLVIHQDFTKNSEIKLECLLRGYPLPEVEWADENGVPVISDDTSIKTISTVDGKTLTFSVLKIKNSTVDDDFFSCTTTNVVGSTKQFFDVNILVSPEIFMNPGPDLDISGINSISENNDFGGYGLDDLEISYLARKEEIEATYKYQTSVNISCYIAESNPPPEIFWYRNGQEIDFFNENERFEHNLVDLTENFDGEKSKTGPSLSILTLKNLVPDDDNSIFTCKAVNKAGVSEEDIKLIVNVPVSFVSSNKNNKFEEIEVEYGNSVILQCQAFGKPAPEINWYQSQKLIGYGSELELLPDKDQNITCEAKNKINKITKTFMIKVLTFPEILPTKNVYDENFMVAEYQNTNISCQAKGNPVPSIIWYKDNLPLNFGLDPLGHKRNVIDYQTVTDKNIQNQNILITSMILFDPIMKINEGTYTCEAKNTVGIDKYDQFLTVMTLPSIVEIDVRAKRKNAGQSIFYIEDAESDEIDVLMNQMVVASCRARGTPEPYVYFVRGEISDNFHQKNNRSMDSTINF